MIQPPPVFVLLDGFPRIVTSFVLALDLEADASEHHRNTPLNDEEQETNAEKHAKRKEDGCGQGLFSGAGRETITTTAGGKSTYSKYNIDYIAFFLIIFFWG